MRPSALFLVLLSIHSGPLIAAQADVPLLPGARVRATAPSLPQRQLQGILTRLDADTIGVDASPLPFATVTRLEVSAGQRTHPGTGLRIGFLVGAVIGAIIGSGAGSENGEVCTPTQCGLAGAGILGLAGIPVGAMIGAMIHTERWQEVPPERWHVVSRPPRPPTLLRMAVAF
jgi:hypothetical protein